MQARLSWLAAASCRSTLLIPPRTPLLSFFSAPGSATPASASGRRLKTPAPSASSALGSCGASACRRRAHSWGQTLQGSCQARTWTALPWKSATRRVAVWACGSGLDEFGSSVERVHFGLHESNVLLALATDASARMHRQPIPSAACPPAVQRVVFEDPTFQQVNSKNKKRQCLWCMH